LTVIITNSYGLTSGSVHYIRFRSTSVESATYIKLSDKLYQIKSNQIY